MEEHHQPQSIAILLEPRNQSICLETVAILPWQISCFTKLCLNYDLCLLNSISRETQTYPCKMVGFTRKKNWQFLVVQIYCIGHLDVETSCGQDHWEMTLKVWKQNPSNTSRWQAGGEGAVGSQGYRGMAIALKELLCSNQLVDEDKWKHEGKQMFPVCKPLLKQLLLKKSGS